MNKYIIILFFVLSAIFILRYSIVGQAVYGDGIFYWAFTHSLYLDHDLDFSNELSHNYSPETNNNVRKENIGNFTDRTPKNYIENRYPPGSPLSWIAIFFLMDIIIFVGNIVGLSPLRNGYSDFYQILVGFENIFFVCVGVLFTYKLLNKIFSERKLTIISIIAVLFGTNLFYYSSLDVVNSHPLSFMLSAIFLYTWLRTLKKRDNFTWLILGVLIGYLASTRTQDITFLSIIIAEIIIMKKKLLQYLKPLLFLGTGLFIGFSPQLIIWQIMYGTILSSPYIDSSQAVDFFHPHFFQIIFDTKRGILFYSPVIIVSVTGLICFLRKKSFAIPLLLSVFMQFLIIGFWSGWHQGESYGIRMVISSMPIFCVGLTYVLIELKKRLRMSILIMICSFFIFLNFTMTLYFHFFVHEPTYIHGNETRSAKMKKTILNFPNELLRQK